MFWSYANSPSHIQVQYCERKFRINWQPCFKVLWMLFSVIPKTLPGNKYSQKRVNDYCFIGRLLSKLSRAYVTKSFRQNGWSWLDSAKISANHNQAVCSKLFVEILVIRNINPGNISNTVAKGLKFEYIINMISTTQVVHCVVLFESNLYEFISNTYGNASKKMREVLGCI